MIAAIGCAACGIAIVPWTETGLRRDLLRATGAALALVTLASFGILLSRTLELDGGVWGTLWRDMKLALTLTHFGKVWRWRVPALVVAWFAWWWGRRHPQHRWTTWLIALAVAAIAMTRSETGHAADHGDFTFAVWVDWAHILAAGAWVGSLFGMTLVVFPKLHAHGDPLRASTTIFQRLSTWCGGALVVLLAGGILNTIRDLGGDVAGLWTTRFGVVLDVKLAIVLAMILIGAHNRYIKLPHLLRAAQSADIPDASLPLWTADRASGVVRACARAVLLESVLGLCVIGTTAVLVHQMPPADAASMHPMSGNTSTPRANAAIVAIAPRG